MAAISGAELSLGQGPSSYGFLACVMLMVAASAAASEILDLVTVTHAQQDGKDLSYDISGF